MNFMIIRQLSNTCRRTIQRFKVNYPVVLIMQMTMLIGHLSFFHFSPD